MQKGPTYEAKRGASVNDAKPSLVVEPLLDHKPEKDVANASIASTVINLSNNIVGAGMFSMPWCLRQSSIVTGVLVTVRRCSAARIAWVSGRSWWTICHVQCFICVLNGLSLILLAKCCELSGTFSYLKFSTMAFGRNFGVVVQARATTILIRNRSSLARCNLGCLCNS
jgi:hypothetical protein